MSDRRRVSIVLSGLTLLAAVVFFLGSNWGLPSRASDTYLFAAASNVWSGARIAEEGGAWAPNSHRAADADANPLTDRSHVIWLNQTDPQKAEILRRYRLFSSQPDEMVTFKALAGMGGGRLDPRMYQYGGLWIYPVGALLKVSGTLGWVTLKSDLNYYLDRPEEFGRFYIVGRVYSGLWGIVGVWAVFGLIRRFSEKLIVPATAAACFIFMPVVVNAAHEAKPHLAGAVLIILSAFAATKYVETGKTKWALLAGAICGMAIGMVLSAAVALAIIPVMVLLRPNRLAGGWKMMAGATAVAAAAYCATNPYVPLNLLRDPDLVRSNLLALGQAKAIAGKSSDIGAVANARRLIADGASIVGGVIGVTGVLVLLFNRAWWSEQARGRVVVALLGAPAALALLLFVSHAGGKTAEFGRFALLPDVALMISGVVLVLSLKHVQAWRTPAAALLVVLVAFQGLSYLAGFLEDARGVESTRRSVAKELDAWWARGARTLGIRAEPAPYCLPPVDVTQWKLLLLPAGAAIPTGEDAPDVLVWPVDDALPDGAVAGTPYIRKAAVGHWPWLKTRISWADKPFEVHVRRKLSEDSPR